MAAASAADRLARWVVAGTFVACSFYINYRFVLVHFALGSDLQDTGWFAWIIGSGDPWLTNPKSVSNLSYFNYHLTPYLSVISVAVHAAGIDRFMAFSVHQGLVFGLITAATCSLVISSWSGWRSAILLAAAGLAAVLGDTTLQMASFPHFEVAIPAICLLATWLWQNGRRDWGSLFFLLTCTVREDGGLYAAAFLFGLALLRPLSRKTVSSAEVLLGAITLALAAVMFWVKERFFPGFSAFAFNYSGNGWDHLTPEALRVRLISLLQNPHALASILPALLLTVVAWRYALFAILMAPLIVAQLLAARVPLWEFRDYYAVPFLIIWAGLIVVATDRARTGKLRLIEPIVLLVFAVLGSAPFLYAVRPPAWLPVAALAVTTPVPDLPALSQKLEAEIAPVPGACVSMGVAAVIPDSFTPEQVIDPNTGVSGCSVVFLYNHDGQYELLTWRVALWTHTATLEGRVERYDQRP